MLSCFTPCGQLELSSDEPLAETIYKALQRSYGTAYANENFYGPMSTRWYGWAMALADARFALKRAGNQADPWQCDDLLTTHERTYGLAPAADDTLYDRHAAFAAALLLPLGPRRGNVEYQLQTALGSDFVAWVTVEPSADLAYPESPWETDGIFGNPATWKTIRLTQYVAKTGTSLTRTWQHVSGDENTISVGDKLVVEPGKYGQQELITITARTISTLTATFTRPHEAGVEAIRQPWPFWLSLQELSFVVVPNGRARDPVLRRTVNNLLHKLLGCTSLWDIVEEDAAPGAVRGFTANASEPNIHPINALSY